MNMTVKMMTLAALGAATLVSYAANGKADKPKPLDPEKSAKYIAFQGGLVMPPDNGNRILVWDATGKASAAVSTFTNVAKQVLSLPFAVRTNSFAGCAYVAAKGVKSAKFPAVLVISEAGEEMPSLAVFPEEAIGCVNFSSLADQDAELTAKRVEKELFRALGFALGGYSVSRTACVMDAVYSREELDANEVVLLSPMRRPGINRAAEKLHLPILRKTLYSQAVRQGWAPAPTNDQQKAIWEKAHAIPKKPMRIEFDPKKGR